MLVVENEVTRYVIDHYSDSDVFDKAIEKINDVLPKGLVNDDIIIGNTLYAAVAELATVETVPVHYKVELQEKLFNNYRFSGTLGDYRNVLDFT